MLPLPGFIKRAIFAEDGPQVEYLDAIAWRSRRGRPPERAQP
jgi:hypothetical protein